MRIVLILCVILAGASDTLAQSILRRIAKTDQSFYITDPVTSKLYSPWLKVAQHSISQLGEVRFDPERSLDNKGALLQGLKQKIVIADNAPGSQQLFFTYRLRPADIEEFSLSDTLFIVECSYTLDIEGIPQRLLLPITRASFAESLSASNEIRWPIEYALNLPRSFQQSFEHSEYGFIPLHLPAGSMLHECALTRKAPITIFVKGLLSCPSY